VRFFFFYLLRISLPALKPLLGPVMVTLLHGLGQSGELLPRLFLGAVAVLQHLEPSPLPQHQAPLPPPASSAAQSPSPVENSQGKKEVAAPKPARLASTRSPLRRFIFGMGNSVGGLIKTRVSSARGLKAAGRNASLLQGHQRALLWVTGSVLAQGWPSSPAHCGRCSVPWAAPCPPRRLLKCFWAWLWGRREGMTVVESICGCS